MQKYLLIALFRGAARYYLDPGSGSMLIQLIIAAVLGLGVFIRVFWKNIKNFFTGGKTSAGNFADPTAIIEDPTEVPTSEIQPEKPTDTTI
jgi:hypothetical protein